jgi:hypothetical protein
MASDYRSAVWSPLRVTMPLVQPLLQEEDAGRYYGNEDEENAGVKDHLFLGFRWRLSSRSSLV